MLNVTIHIYIYQNLYSIIQQFQENTGKRSCFLLHRSAMWWTLLNCIYYMIMVIHSIIITYQNQHYGRNYCCFLRDTYNNVQRNLIAFLVARLQIHECHMFHTASTSPFSTINILEGKGTLLSTSASASLSTIVTLSIFVCDKHYPQ